MQGISASQLNRLPVYLLGIGAFLIIISLITVIAGGGLSNGDGIQSIFLGGLWNSGGTSPKGINYHRPLGLEDRVRCQVAIEHVYWKHRIWGNIEPKPSFETMIDQQRVRETLEDTLRKSKALEVYWKQPITGAQLQAEINRMARNTKDSALLAELWGALNNDSYLVAECLARPLLAERLARNYYSSGSKSVKESSNSIWALRHENEEIDFADWWRQQRYQFAAEIKEPGNEYVLPPLANYLCMFDTWNPVANFMIRANHTAIWTGAEMIVWGGWDGFSYLSTGGRYYPATDMWLPLSLAGAPEARSRHTAVWNGTEMIIWGGANAAGSMNTGGRYNPVIDAWLPTTIANAPQARRQHTAVWTGSRMIIWGGENNDGGANHYYLNTGAQYDATADNWSAISLWNAPLGCARHTAVWTGTEMIIWGGYNNDYLDTGSRYNPIQNSWTETTFAGAPLMRADHTAVWTGTEMIVWGGENDGGALFFGSRYNPALDNWFETSLINVPPQRLDHTAVWSGTEMIIWGGQNLGAGLNNGGRYNPNTDSWILTSPINAPTGRYWHTAVWNGTEMIIFGGYNGIYFGDGGRYCACVDIPPPSNVTALPTGPNTITVSWNPVPGASGYNVYRRHEHCGTSFEGIILDEATIPFWEDKSVSGNTFYQYRITALADCESPPSMWVDATALGNCTLKPCFQGIYNIINNATSPCELTIEWTEGTPPLCSGSSNLSYTLYRGTDPDFIPGSAFELATCITDTFYIDSDVTIATLYHYIVRAEDSTTTGSGPCNNGNIDDNLIRKSGSPTGPVTVLFNDDFESGLQEWSTSANWLASNVLSHSGSFSAYSGNTNNQLCDTLTQINFFPTESTAPPILEFWTDHQVESGYDGGIVEGSTDGITWSKLALSPDYPGTTNSSAQPCLGINLQPAFSGNYTAWKKYRADLAPFAGNPFKVRFNYATNDFNASGGWFIDDVVIASVSSCSSSADAPGRIMNTLSIAKSGSELLLSWGKPLPPCITTNYSIYRGLLPWTGYNHVQLTCSTTGTTYVTPADIDSYYFLVVAQNLNQDGSYGLDSSALQIPPSPAPCFPQNIGTCN
ncbi:MAG: hypothetical protein A2Y62_13560 [Candidatus Fischerbacteria bacterium RBG_13_37_8]|uniref:Fibronectin type-III domain-containing protein n=1 Tax=Candidatus Fischerbacteria bacterium RBG_13_37_8 TaxID=1817863 RepID=A0A1F5VXP6_9BACT|nr:MAG: hypothetical protein A2Y62_13560 [Candidatus Fischerbacteria bacterium RBG_13_37_8]